MSLLTDCLPIVTGQLDGDDGFMPPPATPSEQDWKEDDDHEAASDGRPIPLSTSCAGTHHSISAKTRKEPPPSVDGSQMVWLPPPSASTSAERERPPWERQALRAFSNNRDTHFFKKENSAYNKAIEEGSCLTKRSTVVEGPLDAETALKAAEIPYHLVQGRSWVGADQYDAIEALTTACAVFAAGIAAGSAALDPGKPSPDLSIAGMFYRSAHNPYYQGVRSMMVQICGVCGLPLET